MEFYFCKLYYQGANIYWVNDQIATSVSQIQCVSVFVGPISKIYFTYIYYKPQPITPWNALHFTNTTILVPLCFFYYHTSGPIMLQFSPFHTGGLLCFRRSHNYTIYHGFQIPWGWHMVGKWFVICIEWQLEYNYP